MTDAITEYRDLPWYRTSTMNICLVILGFMIFPPLIWWACINCLTGDIYINKKNANGSFKVWGKANKFAAAGLLILNLVIVGPRLF